jgi:glycosyltransferase involved in cell wall biosynthesis
MSPTFSVVIATYNYGHFLGEAITSVLNGTFTDFEIIVVDDGSSDGTAEVVLPFLSDRRLRYYRTRHRGLSAARNVGIRFAQAPLVAFLDADDLWLPEKLARQLALFRRDPGLGVVYARRLLIDESGAAIDFQEPLLYRGHVVQQIFRRNFVCFSSTVVRAAVFRKVGLFDEELALAMDYDLWLRTAREFRFDYVDEPLVKYRTGHANLSQRIEERLAMVDGIMRRFLDQQGGRKLVQPRVVRQARAELFYHMSVLRRQRSRLSALPWIMRSLTLCPGYGLAWKGLAALPLPEMVRRWVRRALGRPVDWTDHLPTRLPGARAQPGGVDCWPEYKSCA